MKYNNNLTKEEIIQRISYFRTKRGLSAYEMGLRMGHSENYFYRIESGEINLNLEGLLDILAILDVSTSEFFYPDVENFDTDNELLIKFKPLTEEEKKSLITLLNLKNNN